jgi:hypothetical protein
MSNAVTETNRYTVLTKRFKLRGNRSEELFSLLSLLSDDDLSPYRKGYRHAKDTFGSKGQNIRPDTAFGAWHIVRYSPMSRQKTGKNKVDRRSLDFKLQVGIQLQEFDSRATDAAAHSYRS